MLQEVLREILHVLLAQIHLAMMREVKKPHSQVALQQLAWLVVVDILAHEHVRFFPYLQTLPGGLLHQAAIYAGLLRTIVRHSQTGSETEASKKDHTHAGEDRGADSYILLGTKFVLGQNLSWDKMHGRAFARPSLCLACLARARRPAPRTRPHECRTRSTRTHHTRASLACVPHAHTRQHALARQNAFAVLVSLATG